MECAQHSGQHYVDHYSVDHVSHRHIQCILCLPFSQSHEVRHVLAPRLVQCDDWCAFNVPEYQVELGQNRQCAKKQQQGKGAVTSFSGVGQGRGSVDVVVCHVCCVCMCAF